MSKHDYTFYILTITTSHDESEVCLRANSLLDIETVKALGYIEYLREAAANVVGDKRKNNFIDALKYVNGLTDQDNPVKIAEQLRRANNDGSEDKLSIRRITGFLTL